MASEGVPPQASEGASATSDEFNLEDFDEPDAPETETSRRYPVRSARNVNPIYTLLPLGFSAIHSASIQPPMSFANNALKGSTSFHPRKQVRMEDLMEDSLLHASWNNEHSAFLAVSVVPVLPHHGMKMTAAPSKLLNLHGSTRF
eukprot:scaffold25306_cov42-Cyclotella_meneghiniana.AAC.1